MAIIKVSISMTDLTYYKLTFFQRIGYRLKKFFKGVPSGFKNFWVNLGKKIGGFFVDLGHDIRSFAKGFIDGDLFTKGSYALMGLGHVSRGQIVKGILYMILEGAFIAFLALFGGQYLVKFFQHFFTTGSIGTVGTHYEDVWNEELGDFVETKVAGDNSFHIILYGVLTICLVFMFLFIYFKSVRESIELEQEKIIGKKPPQFKKETGQFLDGKFHTTLLSLPLLGLFLFTVVPLITMILIAFTDYDAGHEVPEHLFSWVGFKNFVDMLSSSSNLGMTFWRVLGWTLIWAFFATFTNYFVGMLLAMLINRKGIKLKKLYRTLFVATIAVPQFVSLLIVSKMLDPDGGIITQVVEKLFNYKLQFGMDITQTRILIIIANMWIGVPYSMLMCSGILMNIPSDLYESAKIDGSGPVRTFFKITLPYMLFVTGPYLITTFIGNINNFNVIYLLSGGNPGDILLYTDGAKGTDLLITWLYKLSLGVDRNYKLASVIGILVFIISAVFSLIVYNRSSAVKKEDDFQ